MVMNDLVDVYLEGSTNKPVKMTRTRYTHPALGAGEYVRLYDEANRDSGLVFRESGDGVDFLVALWTVGKVRK